MHTNIDIYPLLHCIIEIQDLEHKFYIACMDSYWNPLPNGVYILGERINLFDGFTKRDQSWVYQ